MGQETGNRLVTALQKQTEKVAYFCTAENVSANVAVHEIRKCFKRTRALLRFYPESPSNFGLIYLNEFQKAGNLLSPVRESFVNCQIFDRITSGDEHIQERKIRQARELFQEKNRLRTEILVEENDGFSAILDLVQNMENQMESNPDHASVKQIYTELCNSYNAGFNLYTQTELLTDGNELHELRKKMKRLWYQVDFAQFMHPRFFRLKSNQLNTITELQGEDHDLYVFLQEIKSGIFDFDSEELLVLENLVEHQRELNQLKLSPRLKQFFNETPEDFNLKMEKIFKVLL